MAARPRHREQSHRLVEFNDAVLHHAGPLVDSARRANSGCLANGHPRPVVRLCAPDPPTCRMFIPAIVLYVIVKAPWLLREPVDLRWDRAFRTRVRKCHRSQPDVPGRYAHSRAIHSHRKNYLADGPLPESDLMAIVRNIGRSLGMLGETLVTSMSTVDDWPFAGRRRAGGFRTWYSPGCASLGRELGQPLPLLALLGTLLILSRREPPAVTRPSPMRRS